MPASKTTFFMFPPSGLVRIGGNPEQGPCNAPISIEFVNRTGVPRCLDEPGLEATAARNAFCKQQGQEVVHEGGRRRGIVLTELPSVGTTTHQFGLGHRGVRPYGGTAGLPMFFPKTPRVIARATYCDRQL